MNVNSWKLGFPISLIDPALRGAPMNDAREREHTDGLSSATGAVLHAHSAKRPFIATGAEKRAFKLGSNRFLFA
jgi:hypothetical protein